MVTDEMVEKAADEMARQDITFANCDRGWQKRTIRAALDAALSAAEPVKPYGYVYESTVRYIDGRSPQRKVDFSYTKKNISDDDIEEFEISETAVYSALSAQVQDVAGWQPIETAQRDGTRLLLMWEPFSGMSEHIELGKWNARNGWVNTYGHAFSGTPTHWMPLPAAPAKQEGGTNE